MMALLDKYYTIRTLELRKEVMTDTLDYCKRLRAPWNLSTFGNAGTDTFRQVRLWRRS